MLTKKTFSILVGIIIIFLLVAVFLGREVIVLKERLASQTSISEEEVKTLVETVGRVIILPEREIPNVATVSDPSKLKDQPFFAKAKLGDKVLIFPQSMKVILWRPSVEKIVEVSTLTTTSPQDASSISQVDDSTQSTEPAE